MNENKTCYEKLIEPFSYEEVNWRISKTFNQDFKKKTARAIVVPYLRKEVIQDRLDDVFGFDGWSNSFQKWGDNAQLCGISFKIGSEIITKWDGAANSEFEAIKGGLSDSFKRAAKMLGIGRYLSKFETIFLEVDLFGDNLKASIRDNDVKNTLRSIYEKEISRIFNRSVNGKSDNIEDPNKNSINLASDLSINVINNLLIQKNINVNSVLQRYNVKSLDELSEVNAQKAIKILLAQRANIA